MASTGTKNSQASSIPPRKLNVQKFAEARAPELEALHSIVSNRLNNDFRCRRNKRRRTTSFDSKAAKKRCRKRRKLGGGDVSGKSKVLDSEGDQKKPLPPRRIRRRIELRKNEPNGFVTSGDGTKRLRTHVWHAKRFTMTNLWGFHLPLGLQGRGRGSRALLKWYRNGVVVHDASYHAAVQLEGPEDSLISIMRMVLDPFPPPNSQNVNNSILSGAVYGTAMLHHVGDSVSQSIAPVTYMWQPLFGHSSDNGVSDHDTDGCKELQISYSSRSLWVWIHAAAFTEGYDALKFASQKQMHESDVLINCLSLEGHLAKLEIMGSKAFQIIKNTLHPTTCNSGSSWHLKKCSVAEADDDQQSKESSILDNEDSISNHSVLSLTVMDPRVLPPKNISDASVSASTAILNDDESEDRAKKHVVLSGISEKDEELVASISPKSDSKNLWDAGSRASCPVDDNVLCLEKYHKRMSFICLDDPKKAKQQPSSMVQGSRSCPVLLLRTGSFMRWSLILPISWVKVFWIHLVSKGAHAIGQRERRWIACEVGLPHFPSDFPDCEAYSSFMASQSADIDPKMARRPPSVRPFKVPIPPPWNCVQSSVGKMPTAVQDIQASSKREMVHKKPLSNVKCQNCKITSHDSHNISFDGIVMRTSSALVDFLHQISGDLLLLFPQAPNRTMDLLKSMENGSRFGLGQNGTDQITSNRKLCFLRVLLNAYKEGVFEEGAIVCAPSVQDVSLYRSGNNEGGLQIPTCSVRSFFEEQCSGKWELEAPKDPGLQDSYRWPIGFVTAGFVRGSKKLVAEAFCEAVWLARLREEQWNDMPVKRRKKEIYVLVRNLRSSAYRLALATVVLEQQDEDMEFL